MTRAIARSLDEIRARHGVTATSLTSGEPYDVAAISGMVGSISGVLNSCLSNVRDTHELVEVYVRPRGDETVFEPLVARHFVIEGEWCVVARRRHPTHAPRIVGIMLAKDEADAIPDVVADLSKTLDALYYLAGDEATGATLAAVSPVGWARAIPDPHLPHADGLRQLLLDAVRADALSGADPRPTWVMVVQGDEIYYDDLKHHVLLAQAERATVMTCQVATFLLHESQREGWDWSLPLAERLTHYIWDFGEHTGFLDHPWIYYTLTEHMRAHPHGIYPAKWASARPVRKHYPFRTPEQARARIADRLRATATLPHGSQPHYANYRDVFVGDKAAGRDVKKYFGWFGEAERVEGIW